MKSAIPHGVPSSRSNMKVTFSHRIEYAAAWVLFKFLRLIGVDAASFIAGKFLRLIGPHLKKVSKRGEVNLKKVYPHWGREKTHKTIAHIWENLGRVGGEFAHLDKFQPSWDTVEVRQLIDKTCRNHNLSHAHRSKLLNYQPSSNDGRVILQPSQDFLAALAKNQQVIFATGHFANWEVMGVICGFVNIPCAIVYRPANNALIDAMIIEKRNTYMKHRQIPKGPEGVRSFIEALKDKYSLGLLVDQKFTDGIAVPFLGHDALTAPAPARMAINYSLPIIPVTVKRERGANFTLKMHDRIPVPEGGDMRERIHIVTERINNVLGDEIDKNPEQWLWFHRRWGK